MHIFKHKEPSIQQLPDKVKILVFRWLKGKYVNLAFELHFWWYNPIVCLGIVT